MYVRLHGKSSVLTILHGIKDSKTKRIQHYKSKVLKLDWISERREREIGHTLEVPPLEEKPNFNTFRGSWSVSAVATFTSVGTGADPESSCCCCSSCCCLRAFSLIGPKKRERQLGSRMTHEPPTPPIQNLPHPLKKKKKARQSLGKGINTSEQT